MEQKDKKSSEWHGIPRNKIKWTPKIDFKKCTGCMDCVNFCTHNVFVEKDNNLIIANPENCVVGCTGCDNICPEKAISHPSKSYLDNLSKNIHPSCDCGGNC